MSFFALVKIGSFGFLTIGLAAIMFILILCFVLFLSFNVRTAVCCQQCYFCFLTSCKCCPEYPYCKFSPDKQEG
jgi:hypothetical protein